MANASFTRDEVILALDVFYSSEKDTGYIGPDKMQELSLLLRRLPIHSIQDDDLSFRSASGIRGQLHLGYRARMLVSFLLILQKNLEIDMIIFM